MSEKRQTPYDFTHMWNIRNKTNEQRGKKEKEKQILNYREQTVVTRGLEGGDGLNR